MRFFIPVLAGTVAGCLVWLFIQAMQPAQVIQTIPVTIQHEGDPAAVTLTLELRANRTVTWTNK